MCSQHCAKLIEITLYCLKNPIIRRLIRTRRDNFLENKNLFQYDTPRQHFFVTFLFSFRNIRAENKILQIYLAWVWSHALRRFRFSSSSLRSTLLHVRYQRAEFAASVSSQAISVTYTPNCVIAILSQLNWLYANCLKVCCQPARWFSWLLRGCVSEVNLIVGWNVLAKSKKLWASFIEISHSEKVSSRNLFQTKG